MKKHLLLLMIALVAIAAMPAWADATVKVDESGANATITFTFSAPAASKVYIAGTMNGWNPEGDLMTKGESGVWIWTLTVPVSEVVVYKYVVDGTWTYDEGAPDYENDPYGGKNGVVNVAAILAGPVAVAEGSATTAGTAVVVAPKLKPISWGTWSKVTLDAKSLTKDVKTKEINGYEFDSLRLDTSSYWKLSGDILPSVNLFTELEVANGSIVFYQENTDGTSVPLVTWADGLHNFAGLFFNPIYTLNSDDNPGVGHFKIAIDTPYVRLLTGYNNAKGSSHSLIYKTVNGDGLNAGPGFLELGLGSAVRKIGDASIDAVIAPNRISGNGVYSWATLSNGPLVVDLAFNAKSWAESLYQFQTNWKGMGTLGASYDFGDFDLKAQSLVNVGHWTPDLTPEQWLDNLAFALNSSYEGGLYGLALNASYAGKDVATLYGDDGTLHQGKIFAELKPWFETIGIKAGFDSNVNFNYKFAEMFSSDINMWAKPYVELDLSAWIPTQLSVKAYGNMSFDLVGATDFGFKLNAAGLGVTGVNLIEGFKSVTLSNAVAMSYDAYDAATKAYAWNKLHDVVMVRASLEDNLNLNVGGRYTTLDSDASATDVARLAPFGAFAGASWVVPAMKKPVAYISFTWNMDPFDGGKDNLSLDGTNYYQPSSIDSGYGESHVRLGLIWSF
ncbi:MAG: glycogen-binding domain-containing protein [Spirochaetia bacterium]|nr:glycogen-binding domain-containing protein [Spirochaetia bacterium]